MFNSATSAFFDFYKYSFIDRILIRIQTRALGVKFERLFIIIPVLIYMNNTDRQKLISNAKEYLFDTIKPKHLATLVYDRIILQLLAYEDDEDLYDQDKKKALDILRQNIQLYLVIDAILDDDFIEQKEEIKNIIKEEYDKAYSMSNHSSNLLRFQEQHFIN